METVSNIIVRTALPKDRSRVQALYAAAGYCGGVMQEDVIYLAELGDELVGVVRRTRERGVTMLRGMQITPLHRRKGIGLQMLHAFVTDLGGEECHCIPYTHLTEFYAAVGFEPAPDEIAPPFLRQRLAEYRARKMSVLLMRRPQANPTRA
jgi:GNAT superfamily N-acetyltransferase